MVGGGRTIIIIIILEGDAVYGWVESGCHRHLSLVEGWYSVVGGLRWCGGGRWGCSFSDGTWRGDPNDFHSRTRYHISLGKHDIVLMVCKVVTQFYRLQTSPAS
jgi:hypothetical protein